MIPALNHSYVLPPFEGGAMSSVGSSPYESSASELVQRFGFSAERRALLDGLMRYRAALRSLGFLKGFQWLDGSFVEDVESREKRSPADIDVVTFAHPPSGLNKTQINQIMSDRPELFVQSHCREHFGCDPHIVNLTTQPEWLVTQARYWYGLFSHRRGDMLWKGMLQLSLDSDDACARAMIDPEST